MHSVMPGLMSISFEVFMERAFSPLGPIDPARLAGERHFQLQVNFLFADQRFAIDMLLVFERWKESLALLERTLHLPKSALDVLSRRKSRASEHGSCSATYTAKMWNKLVHVFGPDFCVLGFSRLRNATHVAPPINPSSALIERRREERVVNL